MPRPAAKPRGADTALPQPAFAAAACITSAARASVVCCRRNASGSALAFLASSSMNDSLANELEKPPRLRSADVRGSDHVTGSAALRVPGTRLKLLTKLRISRLLAKLYVTGALRVCALAPNAGASAGAEPVCCIGSRLPAPPKLGRELWLGLYTECSHAMQLAPVTPPRILCTIAGVSGSQPCSSARVHCSRIGLPTSLEIKAASAAASSAPLWP